MVTNTAYLWYNKKALLKKGGADTYAVTKAPDKINYYIGDDFDPTGMEVTATFSNGSKMILPMYAMSGYENLQYGDKVVIISYLDGGKDGIEKSCLQQINVTGYPEVKSIEITGVTPPVAGASMSTSFNITGGDKDYVNASSLVGAWFRTETPPTSVEDLLDDFPADEYEEAFTGGKYYTFVPTMKTIEKVTPWDFTATVNGNNAMTFAKDTTTAYVYQMYVAYTFYCPETAPTNHSISVTDGTPSKTSAAAGESITITANAPAGKQFSHWEVLSGGVTLANANNASTTFTMKNANVSIKAHFVNSISNIALNVPSPTAGTTAESCKPATATTGTSIPAGYGNYTWYSSDGTALAAGETFTAGTKYTLKVAVYRGTNYAFGSPLTVTFNGKSGTIEQNYGNYAICTFDFTTPDEYGISIIGGKAYFPLGTIVTAAAANTDVSITADPAPAGKVFDKWVVKAGGITVENANSATTTFTMPATAVEIEATYKDDAGSGETIYNLTGGGTFTKGSTEGLTFISDAPYSKFARVEIDDTIIFDGYYDVAEGSTIVTLKPEYLNDKPARNYSITIVSDDGYAAGTFTIQEAPGTEPVISASVVKEVTSTPENGEFYVEGEKITYSITVTNTGDVSFDGGYDVYDSLANPQRINGGEHINCLAECVEGDADNTRVFTFEYTVTAEDAEKGSVSNYAWLTYNVYENGDLIDAGVARSNTVTSRTGVETIVGPGTNPGEDEKYDITVINGKATIGAGTIVTESEAGVTITITADAPASGKVFDKWIIKSDTQPALAKATDAATTFTMPQGAVTVEATYKDAPVTPGDDPTQPGDDPTQPGDDPTQPGDDPTQPQTGDNSQMFLWIALLFVSGAGAAATTILGKKKRYNR